MKKFTQEEINEIKNNLDTMKSGYDDIKLSDLNQNNLNEFIELFNLLVSEYAATQGRESKNLPNILLDEIDNETFLNLVKIMIEASEGLYEVAKSRIEG